MSAALPPFLVCGVVHLVRPLGFLAQDIAGLREGIAGAEPASLFYHAVQPPLRSPAWPDLPPTDFTAWVDGVLQDHATGEQLTFAVQRSGPGAAALRAVLIDALEGAGQPNAAAPPGGAFAFLAADSVPIPLEECASPEALFAAFTRADASAWFFHLVEQPWFSNGFIPVAAWLAAAGAVRQAKRLEELAASGLPLETLRREVVRGWRRSRLGGRVARAVEVPEGERAEVARDTVTRFARRLVRGDAT